MQNVGLDEAQAGIKIAGRNINNLRYADDTILIAESEEELKSLLPVWITANCGKFLKRWEYHLTCLLRNIYVNREATLRTRHGMTDWFQIGKGVHQGHIMSPCLYN